MSNEDKFLDLGRSPAESAVHRLLCKLGKLLPETADDVKRAEAELVGEPVEVPAELMDPDVVFDGSISVSLPASRASSPAVADAEMLEGFSAAARAGRGLSSEVKEKMEQDWERARREGESEDGSVGPSDRGAS